LPVINDRSENVEISSTLQIQGIWRKARKEKILKIFALCIGLVFGIFAIAVYAYGLKHRMKELTDKSDENS
jgi:hypothetical protein